MKIARFLPIPLLVAVATLTFGQGGSAGGFQGGAGGAGGGGFGGGAFGGGGGFMGDDEQRAQEQTFPRRSQDNINENQSWERKVMILTPGDRVEWKVKGKKGQAFFAVAASDIFDPALSVVNEKGQTLVENDDQQDGDQTPFISFFFPDDAEYKITVKNYRSSAGGKFTLNSFFFKPIDLALGKNEILPMEPADMPYSSERYFHIKAKKGEVYALENPTWGQGNQLLNAIRIVGPSGVGSKDFKQYRYWQGHRIFEALADGDYYVAYSHANFDAKSRPELKYKANLSVLKVEAMEAEGVTKFHLEPHEFRVFTFPVKKSQFLRTTTTPTVPIGDNFSAPKPKGNIQVNSEDRYDFEREGVLAFAVDLTKDGDYVRLFGGDGDVNIVYFNPNAKASDVTVTNSSKFPEFTTSTTISQKLGLGQYQYYLINGFKGDNMKLTMTATGLEPEIEIVDAGGYRQNFLDRKRHQIDYRFYMNDNRTFLIRVGSAGGGGMGDIKLDYLKVKPQAYKLGSIGVGSDSDPVLNTFTVNLEAAQKYQILVENFVQVPELINSKGDVILPFASTNFGTMRAFYYAPDIAGEYKLRLFGAQDKTKFKMEKYTIPKIDSL